MPPAVSKALFSTPAKSKILNHELSETTSYQKSSFDTGESEMSRMHTEFSRFRLAGPMHGRRNGTKGKLLPPSKLIVSLRDFWQYASPAPRHILVIDTTF